MAEFEGSTNLKIVTLKLYQQENQIKVLVHTQYFAVIKKAAKCVHCCLAEFEGSEVLLLFWNMF